MSKQEGVTKALENAREKFDSRNAGNIRAFGVDYEIKEDGFVFQNQKEAKDSDQILILNYLEKKHLATKTDKLISYKNFKAGEFYYDPFLSRTTNILSKRFKHDINGLKENIKRLDHETIDKGDFSAKIHCIGDLYLHLTFHLADEEFPAESELLFTENFLKIYDTENAVVLASKMCISLM